MILRYSWWYSLLIIIILLSACTGDDVDIDTSIPDNELVEVQLAMSTGGDMFADTRMSNVNTQAEDSYNVNENFLGIDYLYLVPFNTNPSHVISSSTRLSGTPYNMYSNNAYSNKKIQNRLYFSFMIPYGTSSFLIYGHSSKGGINASPADKFANGSSKLVGLDFDSTTPTASEIGFEPDLIGDDDDFAQYKSALIMAGDMAKYMTSVANAHYQADGKDYYWRDATGPVMTLYKNLTHEGFPFVITDAATLNNQLKAIRDYSDLSYTGSQLQSAVYNAANTAYNKRSKWSNFGRFINYLPSGLILFKWEEGEKKFIVLNALLDKKNVNGGDDDVYRLSKKYLNPSIADYRTIAYPAQLLYYANSLIHTSEVADLTGSDLNALFNNSIWNNVWLNNTDIFTGKQVNNETTIVAVEERLNYGVSMLQMQVKANPNSSMKVPTNLLQWTGVLVTNQHKVDFNFEPKGHSVGQSVEYDNYLVYDNAVKKKNGNIIYISKSSSYSSDDKNRTLVFPSNPNETVYVIVEIFNNSQETFTGYKGCLILPQTHFYLVGKLDPTKGTKPKTYPTTSSGTKLFESDLYAKATAQFSSYEGAYNYVPDLDSPALVLGLEVSLDWQQAEPNSVWLH